MTPLEIKDLIIGVEKQEREKVRGKLLGLRKWVLKNDNIEYGLAKKIIDKISETFKEELS